MTDQTPTKEPFNPDVLEPGDECIIHYGINGTTRARFVRRTRNPDWFFVTRWNPYERRWVLNPVRIHRRAFIRRAAQSEA